MSVFKCKMCGGELEISADQRVATCEYCGTVQTLPKLDNDRRANLYDRANHFRRNNDFDKAMGIYEQILGEDRTDAEAYWSLVLCRYGIEYVEDPATHKRVPTVNRAQFTAVFDDENYKSALQYADGAQRTVYESEAKAINKIQKGILAISQKEEPFDVFICYKETDNNGRRTPDSVLANDLYHQLTQEGFKVFFARITLEDKLGSAYEPYIFAALNSAKVMVVLGTKPEFFNAVWVKNEWSRYLSLIRQGQKKVLIPAFKDMDPYDLPEEFSHLQAQDMGKLGFMQDLIRGVKKLTQTNEPKPAPVKERVISGESANTAPLLRRAFLFLEDGEWDSADEYCEKVLDIDPENAQAYLGKLMADLRVSSQAELKDEKEPFDENGNYQKVLRFGDEDLKATLEGYIDYIVERNEQARLEGIYTHANSVMQKASTEREFKEAARLFASISGWRDADTQVRICEQQIQHLTAKAKAARLEAKRWEEAKRIEAERQRKIREREEALRDRRNRKIVIIATVIAAIIIAALVVIKVVIPNKKYNDAVALIEAGNVIDAYEALIALDGYKNGYKDSAEKADSIYYEYKSEKLKSAEVGDYVIFGAYEQDNDTANGKEAIVWLVLDKQDGKILVISKYALDCKLYNTEWTDVTWETCSLRKWLNNEFTNAAFSTEEQTMIPTVTVLPDKNPNYSTNPGHVTEDQVFLLSITEAKQYFRSDDARQCKPTDYAVANGADVNSDNGNCDWWLRSPGQRQDSAAVVNSSNGGVNLLGGWVGYDGTYAVRPALWIDLNA